MTTGKTIALTRRTFVGKVMPLLLNMLSRLVMTFLPRSKPFLISWLQSLSTVILYPKKIKCHCFNFYLPWSISVQSLSRVWLFVTPWITARQASLSITNSQSSLRLTSIESVMPSSHLILCHPVLLLLPIPPSIRVFSNESTVRMRWPKSHPQLGIVFALAPSLHSFWSYFSTDLQ